MRRKKSNEKLPITRVATDINFGLNTEEINERVEKGYINSTPKNVSKSYWSIIRTNVFTLFNGLNLLLGVLVLVYGDIKNAMFLGIATANMVIGIIQEIRSKKVVERLSLMTEPKVRVLRNGEKQNIDINNLVIDDIVELKAGNQVPSDCSIVDGSIEVNESLLTGEQDAVKRNVDDQLFSGSFVVSGSCKARVENVGEDNYANKIINSAKKYKKPNSKLMQGIQFIIRAVTILILIIGPLVFLNNKNNLTNIADVINRSVGSIIGMIPEGLVLITSVALAVGVVRLAKKRTLVQELYCIETLARVDMLCLDKTGTITEGTMQVEDTILVGATNDSVRNIIGSMVVALDDNNATFMALKDAYVADNPVEYINKLPFNSTRKMSAVTFSNNDTYIIGAPEFVLKDRVGEIQNLIDQNTEKGYRVLVLARTQEAISEQDFDTKTLEIVAVIVISDKIRENAKDTLSYFARQGVELKIISGDNPITVSKIAERVGLKNAKSYIDATTLETDEQIYEAVQKYTIFGRVTPTQKKQIVKSLKRQGHTVGMTGDGVNDVMALKAADCSIAMASGSDAARNSSQLVLLDSDFSALPDVVAEGRRVVNNINRAAALFLVKTTYSILLAICMIIMDIRTPFEPIQLSFISSILVGFPSFFLAIEPNNQRISGEFLPKVIKTATPAGITITIMIVLAHILFPELLEELGQMSTFCLYIYALLQFFVLYTTCKPLDIKRGALFATCVIVFFSTLAIIPDFIKVKDLPTDLLPAFVVFVVMLYPTVKMIELAVALLVNLSTIVHNKFNISKKLKRLSKPLISKKEKSIDG